MKIHAYVYAITTLLTLFLVIVKQNVLGQIPLISPLPVPFQNAPPPDPCNPASICYYNPYLCFPPFDPYRYTRGCRRNVPLLRRLIPLIAFAYVTNEVIEILITTTPQSCPLIPNAAELGIEPCCYNVNAGTECDSYNECTTVGLGCIFSCEGTKWQTSAAQCNALPNCNYNDILTKCVTTV